ncbi:hypothetical protein CYMTET_13682, partial [Cymbomonas tetramitiformis]
VMADLCQDPEFLENIGDTGLCFLAEQLRKLSMSQREEVETIAVLTIMNIATQPRFLAVPLGILYPLVHTIRCQLDLEDNPRRQVAGEVLNNLAQSDRLDELPKEVMHMLLGALSVNLASAEETTAEYASKITRTLVSRMDDTDSGDRVVQQTILETLTDQMKNGTQDQILQAVKGVERLASSLVVGSVAEELIERTAFRLVEFMSPSLDNAKLCSAATKALGALALSSDGQKMQQAVLHITLQHLFRVFLTAQEHESRTALVTIANLLRCDDWQNPLARHISSPQMDTRKFMSTVCEMLHGDEMYLVEAANTILDNMVVQIGLPEPMEELFVNGMAQCVHDSMGHGLPTEVEDLAATYAVNLIEKAVVGKGIQWFNALPDKTINNWFSAILAHTHLETVFGTKVLEMYKVQMKTLDGQYRMFNLLAGECVPRGEKR